MRNIPLYRMRTHSSSIVKELINNTISKKINWISFEKFIDFLEVEGLAFDNIPWFYSYIKHIQAVRHYPSYSKSYVAFYDNHLFAVSKSEIFRELRIDFTSTSNREYTWRGIIDSQESLFKLHSIIEMTNTNDSNEECQEILMSTGCIHA